MKLWLSEADTTMLLDIARHTEQKVAFALAAVARGS
jgi:hypothetical protein